MQDAHLNAIAAGINSDLTPHEAQLAAFLAQVFGPKTLAVIYYGSQVQRSDARPDSIHDFFVVVDDYSAAFNNLNAVVGTRFSPRTATVLAHWFPPNVVAVTARVNGQTAPAKCVVYSTAHFLEATSAHPRDHYAQGRLFQYVKLVWARDALARQIATSAVIATRLRTLDWVRTSLPDSFSIDGYLHALLERSFAAEIRPEAKERIMTLLHAQLPLLRSAYGALLERLCAAGELEHGGSGYRLVRRPEPLDHRRADRYFLRSKLRSILRLPKHPILYDGWSDYIFRKIERRSGLSTQITAREQRWPLLYLWRHAIRMLSPPPKQRGE